MKRPLREDQADYVVVGTGAGGATAARVLSGAGHEVLLVEEGAALPLGRQPVELLASIQTTMRFGGQLVVEGRTPMTLLQGRVVGGSTAINSGIIWRLPGSVREEWTRDHGLGDLVGPALDLAFERIEDELGIAPTPEGVVGGNGRLLREGAERLGLPGEVTLRNAPGCQGAARCLQGCPTRAKQSMDVSYVPRTLQAGGRLHARTRVVRVLQEGGRAAGVEAEGLDADGRVVERVRLSARRGVVLSAGALFTPIILRRSGLRGQVGEGFVAHPGVAAVGLMTAPVGMGHGATQSYQVPDFERGFKIESLTLPPEMLAARLPGAGAEWQARLARLDRYAQWAVIVRAEARGRVRPGPGGVPRVRYSPTARDLETARQGLAQMARVLFAAGAVEVHPGMGGRPEILTDPDQVRLLEEGPLGAQDLHMMASHLMGGATASADPGVGVVGPDLEVRDLPGLFVMDGSVFPTATGVNPQHTIMGLTWVAADRLAQRTTSPRATRAVAAD